MEIALVKTQRDYRRALKEIEGLMQAERNTPEGIAWTCSLRWWRRGSAIDSDRTCPAESPIHKSSSL
jgi:hypothetical protein